ncbi:hypothetical protein NLC26_03215 [Candidatus Aminicenantes bacterium AC-708-M15]|jgi:hypothetical protein|nr:hypothetical protein [SCandidatus Aminicenantes bacterium Aminicenantia_JdfR_composite]MCP2597015.1 hypothetical protein [Candidatus Aminicenantes bacterium AC-335-G13]MCP2604474.1 hypothetical protein [Candidatus Aminicenantes bacterium AC-708-M15]MCP2619372.1 hypothetical protein [Candidatus Aminicenantes bacterium AC-335-K20]
MREENQVSISNMPRVQINYNLEGKLLDFNSREILIELFHGLKVGKEYAVRIVTGNRIINATGLIVMSTVSSITNENVIFLTKIRLKENSIK